MNKVILMGRLGQDPDMRATASGDSVANFSLATSERRKDKDHTEWHKVVVWGKTAENVKVYLSKGSKVLVEGKIATREWVDKDKVKRYSTEIMAGHVQFLDPAPERKNLSPQTKGQEPHGHDFDNIPF